MFRNLSDAAIIQRVIDNPSASTLELELVDRLQSARDEIEELTRPAPVELPAVSRRERLRAAARRLPVWAYAVIVLALLLALPDSPLVDTLEAYGIVHPDSPYEHEVALKHYYGYP